MTSLKPQEPVRDHRPWLLLLTCAALGLAACSGSTGKHGASGPPGSVGPPGPSPEGGLPVASAKSINTMIASVTVNTAGKPVVEVRLTNESGRPLKGLPAGNIGFVLARLEPGVNGAASTWHAITRRTDAFPGSPAPTPADHVTGTASTSQATTETATAGTWVESSIQNGVYTYTFSQSLTGISDIPYDGNLVHRVGLEIRTSPNLTATNIPANNATYTWIPATGQKLEQSGREIVSNAACNACHDKLAVHGEARFDLPYCAMCHESYSFDAQSGNTIDLRVMIHKIHSGATLPSVVAGGFYGIFGYGNTFNDFSDIVWPQDLRNCQTCHRESDANTPQAVNYRLTVTRGTCGSCHDTTDWTTGENHGGVAATDDTCLTCHGPDSQLGLRAEQVHVVPKLEAGRKFKLTIVSVTGTAPGQTPIVKIKVTDPTNGNAPYDIRLAPFNAAYINPSNGRASGASLSARVAWSTRDYNNLGGTKLSTSTSGQPLSVTFVSAGVLNASVVTSSFATDGTFSAPANSTTTGVVNAIPAGATGSGLASVQAAPYIDLDGSGTWSSADQVSVDSVSKVVAITDATPTARRAIVDVAKCNDCHKPLTLHGSRTNNEEFCAGCHNPAAATAAGPIDFKYMIHALHNGTFSTFPQFNTGVSPYPGRLNNCEGCHKAGTYYPVDPAKVQATTTATGALLDSTADDTAMTPNASVCSSCHTDPLAKTHIEQQGGSFNATKNADGTSNAAALETCGTCHGSGRAADVKVMHNVAGFTYN